MLKQPNRWRLFVLLALVFALMPGRVAACVPTETPPAWTPPTPQPFTDRVAEAMPTADVVVVGDLKGAYYASTIRVTHYLKGSGPLELEVWLSDCDINNLYRISHGIFFLVTYPSDYPRLHYQDHISLKPNISRLSAFPEAQPYAARMSGVFSGFALGMRARTVYNHQN